MKGGPLSAWTTEDVLSTSAVNGMTPNYIQELFEVKEIPYNLRDPTRTIIPKSNSTTYSLKSLKHEGNKIWNRLSVDIKNIGEPSYF